MLALSTAFDETPFDARNFPERNRPEWLFRLYYKITLQLGEACRKWRGTTRCVTRLDGARGKKQIWRPMLEPEVCRKQMYCIEESTCDNVGTFQRPPRSDSAPGELCTPCSLVMPLGTTHHRRERNIPGFSKISQISFSVLMFARRRWQASFWSIKCSKVFSKFTSTSSAFLLLCRKMFNIIETAPKYLQRSWRSLHTLKKQSLLDAVCVQPWLTTVWIRTWMH